MFIAIRSIYKKYLQIFPRSEALCVACGCLANPSGLSGHLCGPLASPGLCVACLGLCVALWPLWASVWPLWASVWPPGQSLCHSRPVSVDLSAFSGLSLVIT